VRLVLPGYKGALVELALEIGTFSERSAGISRCIDIVLLLLRPEWNFQTSKVVTVA